MKNVVRENFQRKNSNDGHEVVCIPTKAGPKESVKTWVRIMQHSFSKVQEKL